ncbi:hypothetical protein HPP92_028565 [Vanilla planifolia]|uniref:Uncharacterized protein n=1 Tax=Vanilla planifolia TaxID=51239 RepID=A0A835P830_VANPL|nr:hypothetical protein HPP92_028565 [Vanilla planifolia]KAG0446998.1 hypothetical protein HPP92_028570 [Vanilla planifolia]
MAVVYFCGGGGFLWAWHGEVVELTDGRKRMGFWAILAVNVIVVTVFYYECKGHGGVYLLWKKPASPPPVSWAPSPPPAFPTWAFTVTSNHTSFLRPTLDP